MMDSDTWGGLNAVLNQILALEAQPGVTYTDINDFEYCATTASAMHPDAAHGAAYDPTQPDCFTAHHSTFILGGDADLATHPFDWTRTTAFDDPACDPFDAQDLSFDGATIIPTAAVHKEVDHVYLFGVIRGFQCRGEQWNHFDCDLNGATIQDMFEYDATYYCKLNAANTCAGINFCSEDEDLTCQCFHENQITLAAEVFTTPIIDYFKNGCYSGQPIEDGAGPVPALKTAHLDLISRALVTLPAFGPTEAREVVRSHIKSSMYLENDFNKLTEIDICFENDGFIKHLTFILNNMAKFAQMSQSAQCSPDFLREVFNRWDFSDPNWTSKIDWSIIDFTGNGLSEAYQASLLDGFIQGNPYLAATDNCTPMMTTSEEYELQVRLATQFQGECTRWTGNNGSVNFICPDQDTESQCFATFGPDFTMETCLDLNCVFDGTYKETCTLYEDVGRWGWESSLIGYWGYNFFVEALSMYCDNYVEDVYDYSINCSASGVGGISGDGINIAMSNGRQAEILAGVTHAIAIMPYLEKNGKADLDFVHTVSSWFQENDSVNLHVVENIMSMDNIAWEGFNFLLQAGTAIQDDSGYEAAGGASGLVALYNSFSNFGSWDGAWRTGEGNEAAAGEWLETNGWINNDGTWWRNTIDSLDLSAEFLQKWNTKEQYDTFYNHIFKLTTKPSNEPPPNGPSFGETSPPGAFASSLSAWQMVKINQDVINTFDECLQVNSGISDLFRARLSDPAFVHDLTDDGSVLPCDGIGALLDRKITDYIISEPDLTISDPLLTEWNAFKDPSNPQCPGCWTAQVIRAELQLRAFKQWGEDSKSGFNTLEDFCAYDFTQIVTCADDGNAISATELSDRITELGLPKAIYDSLHESDKVSSAPFASPAGALASGLAAWQMIKVNQDIMNTWDECLQNTPGISYYFRSQLSDPAFIHSLTDDGSVLPCIGIGAILEDKITNFITHPDYGAATVDPMALLAEWNNYKDPANPQCPGCWAAQVIRAELQLRALKQWGEGYKPGFSTLEEFCDFDFTQIVTCADDGNVITAAQLSERITAVEFPLPIYDSLHESDKVENDPAPEPVDTETTTSPASG